MPFHDRAGRSWAAPRPLPVKLFFGRSGSLGVEHPPQKLGGGGGGGGPYFFVEVPW